MLYVCVYIYAYERKIFPSAPLAPTNETLYFHALSS